MQRKVPCNSCQLTQLSQPFPSMQDKRECPFGDKCQFQHDVAEYMATKPADIGESCYLYDTFGKCGYGLCCRFAKAHTTPDFKTMENAELVRANEGKSTVKNNLSKDLQIRLRKRSVTFNQSAEYLDMLSNQKDKREQRGNGKKFKMDVVPTHTWSISVLLILTICQRILRILKHSVAQ